MTFVIVENLRAFFNSRPPLVVFMICLASFAIALITFAYIVKTKDLRNPDITEDWNTFLEKLSHLKFCVSQNATSHNMSTPLVKVGDLSPGDALESIKDKIIENKVSNEPLQVQKRSALEFQAVSGGRDKTEPTYLQGETTWGPSSAPISKNGMINETFHLNIEFIPSPEFVASAFKSAYLTSEMTGNMLSMKGIHREQHISMALTFSTNASDCVEKTGRVCSMYIINTCVTFTGPASMLPRSRHVRKGSCSTETAVAAGSLVRPMSASLASVSSIRNWCSQASSLAVQYSFDDSFTVLLSEDDRSVINLHLMRTSYFLFVMVVTLFCYAAVRGRPGKVKTVIHVPHDKIKSLNILTSTHLLCYSQNLNWTHSPSHEQVYLKRCHCVFRNEMEKRYTTF